MGAENPSKKIQLTRNHQIRHSHVRPLGPKRDFLITSLHVVQNFQTRGLDVRCAHRAVAAYVRWVVFGYEDAEVVVAAWEERGEFCK